MSAHANRTGILAMAGGMACFVTNDSIVKHASESLNAGQLIFIRGVFSIALLVAAAQAMGALRQARGLLDGKVLARGALDAIATVVYLTSLFHLPLGNATAINMVAPLMITLFAVVVLHDRVGVGRWLAIATGFAGVLLVVQPTGAGFNAFALLCLGGTAFHASRDLLTRFIDPALPSILITIPTAVAVTLLAGAWTLLQGWQSVEWRHLALLGAASIFLSSGYCLTIVAMRSGDISTVAPFRYSGLLFALVLGWVVWGEVPNAMAWIGIAMLTGAGLFVLYSERRRANAALEAAAD